LKFVNVLELTAAGRTTRLGVVPQTTLHRVIYKNVTPKVLVVDELGYLPMSREEANLFFRLVARRYERASLIRLKEKRRAGLLSQQAPENTAAPARDSANSSGRGIG
jgi:hypothetical protein